MGWGGGYAGGFGGGGGHGAADAAGLPFAGVPAELAASAERLLADEPEHPEPDIAFRHGDYDRRPLTIRRLLAPVRWAVLGSLLLVVMESVVTRVGPTLLQLAIDKGMGLENLGRGPIEGSKTFLWAVAGVYAALVVVSIVLGNVRARWTGVLGERLLYDLRVRVFSHLQRLSLDFFTGERAGRLMTRMTSDIDNLQQLLHEGVVQLLAQALTVVVLAVQLFVFSPRLALFTLLFVTPAMVLLSLWFERASTRGYATVRDRIAAVLTDLSETLAGIRVVTAHNRQRRNVDAHTAVVGEYRAANNHTAALAAVYGPGAELVGNAATVLVLFVGGRMALAGDLNVGELAGFMVALTGLFAPVQQLAQLYNTYQQGQAGLIKLRELLAVEPSVVESPAARPLPPVEGRVTLEHVTFEYRAGRPVLHDVSLEIPAGATVALVGETGSGKSTIAKLLARFYDPVDGRILVDGHDVREVTIESLRRCLGVVPQEPFLFHGTLRDNIAFASPDVRDEDVLEAARLVGLGDLIDRLPDGIGTVLHERGSSLSSGERQLVALARAFLHQPQVLILDEATSNLDLRSEQQVDRALDVVLTSRTSLVIAHRLSTAMRADTIAVLHAGRLVETGSHDELVAAGGLYTSLYETWSRDSTRGRRREGATK